MFSEYLFLKRNNTAVVEEWGEEPKKCFYAFSHLQSFSPLQAEWNWIFCKCGALFAIAPSDMPMGHSDQWIKTTGEGCWLNLLTFHPLMCRDGATSAWLSQPRPRLEEPGAGWWRAWLPRQHLPMLTTKELSPLPNACISVSSYGEDGKTQFSLEMR